MKITSLRQYKGTTFEVVIDNERKLYLHIDIINDFGLSEGSELTRDELLRVIYSSNFRRAYQYALYCLDYRDYSRKEMLDKLIKTYKNEKLCSAVTEKLESAGIIDDRRYAEKLAAKYVESKKFGIRRAKFEMLRKGIPEDIADEYLEPMREIAGENLSYLLKNKYSGLLEDEDDRKSVEKAKSSLVRYGYNYGEINNAVHEYFENAATEEDN